MNSSVKAESACPPEAKVASPATGEASKPIRERLDLVTVALNLLGGCLVGGPEEPENKSEPRK
jgi:hypothetical protein